MVETLAECFAPMSVLGSDGFAHGVCFGLADQSGSVGIHQIFHHTGTGVVTRDEEHLHARRFGLGIFGFLLAQRVPLRFLTTIGFELFVVRFKQRVVYGLCQPTHPRQRPFSGSGRSNDESLQARILAFASVDEVQQLVESGSEYSYRSQQQDVLLGRRIAAVYHLLQEMRPLIVRETRQANRFIHLLVHARRCVGVRGLQVLQVCKFLVEAHPCQLRQM